MDKKYYAKNREQILGKLKKKWKEDKEYREKRVDLNTSWYHQHKSDPEFIRRYS